MGADGASRQALEDEVRALMNAGRGDDAVVAALRGYGPEIHGLLLALHASPDDASEVFSAFSEDLWKGLAGFTWSSSLRTWAYVLARHASHRHRREGRRRKADVPLSAAHEISRIEDRARTGTATWRKTERRTALIALREKLPEDDQMLLILRLDRALAWDELARVIGGDELDEAGLKREAARLRKRYQLLKERLVAIGRREGLVKPRTDS